MTLPKPKPKGQETSEATASITAASRWWIAALILQTHTSAETTRQPPKLMTKESLWHPLPSRYIFFGRTRIAFGPWQKVRLETSGFQPLHYKQKNERRWWWILNSKKQYLTQGEVGIVTHSLIQPVNKYAWSPPYGVLFWCLEHSNKTGRSLLSWGLHK